MTTPVATTITISDPAGATVRRMRPARGLNRVVWDMHMDPAAPSAQGGRGGGGGGSGEAAGVAAEAVVEAGACPPVSTRSPCRFPAY